VEYEKGSMKLHRIEIFLILKDKILGTHIGNGVYSLFYGLKVCFYCTDILND